VTSDRKINCETDGYHYASSYGDATKTTLVMAMTIHVILVIMKQKQIERSKRCGCTNLLMLNVHGKSVDKWTCIEGLLTLLLLLLLLLMQASLISVFQVISHLYYDALKSHVLM
jgi:hypothetical protein